MNFFHGGSFWLSMFSRFLMGINIQATRLGMAWFTLGLFSKSTVLDTMLICEHVVSQEDSSAGTNSDRRNAPVTWVFLSCFRQMDHARLLLRTFSPEGRVTVTGGGSPCSGPSSHPGSPPPAAAGYRSVACEDPGRTAGGERRAGERGLICVCSRPQHHYPAPPQTVRC